MTKDENPQLEVLMTLLNEKIKTYLDKEVLSLAHDVMLPGGYYVISRAASFGETNEIVFIITIKRKEEEQHGENTVNEESDSL